MEKQPNRETATHLRTFVFSKDKWDSLIALGEQRSRQKALYSTTRLAREGTHELGMIGEAVFSRLINQKLNTELLIKGDGKFDFIINGVKFDVKTTSHFDTPWLRVTPDDLEKAAAFALVAVDETRLRARYCGYTTADVVRKATLVQIKTVMPASYRLRKSEISHDLP